MFPCHEVMMWIAFSVCLGRRHRFGGFGCYEVITQPSGVTWHEASNHCTALNKTLLAIDSDDENEAVKYYLEQYQGQLEWINLLCGSLHCSTSFGSWRPGLLKMYETYIWLIEIYLYHTWMLRKLFFIDPISDPMNRFSQNHRRLCPFLHLVCVNEE